MKLPDRVNQSPITVEFEWRGEVVTCHLAPFGEFSWYGNLWSLRLDVDAKPTSRHVTVWVDDEEEYVVIKRWWFS